MISKDAHPKLGHFSLQNPFFSTLKALWIFIGFFFDFGGVLEGFWEGFGRPKGSKNRDFGWFFEYAFRANHFGENLFNFQ